jgi:hypothetical protein
MTNTSKEITTSRPETPGLERRSDCQLSTLRDSVETRSGRLEISAVFDDMTVPAEVDDEEAQVGVAPVAPR